MDWANSSDRLETYLWKYQSGVHCKIIIPHTNPHGVSKARQAQLLLCVPLATVRLLPDPYRRGCQPPRVLFETPRATPNPNSDSLFATFASCGSCSHMQHNPHGTWQNSSQWLFYLLPAATSPPSAAASGTSSPISCIHVFLIILLWLSIYWSPTKTAAQKESYLAIYSLAFGDSEHLGSLQMFGMWQHKYHLIAGLRSTFAAKNVSYV